MATNFVAEGHTIDYTNGGTAITAGDIVVMEDTVGVAMVDIANGETGAVRIEGVFTLPKSTGTAWSAGDALDFDASAGAAGEMTIGVTPAAGDVVNCGVAYADAASNDATGQVKLGGTASNVT